MRSRFAVFAAVLLLSGAAGSQPAETEDRRAESPSLQDAKIAFAPDAIVWTDGPPSLPPGSKAAVLEGSPRGSGMFTMRVRVPAGSVLPPHWHPRHERVTVLSGTVELGFGNVADPRNVTRYGPGSFYVNPPREMHFLFFPEETELQMTGVGPWEIHTTDIEPRGPKPTANIVVRNITPPPGTELTSETELVAQVDYSIANFRPDTFYLTMQFESIVPNQTFNASGAIIMARPDEPPPPPPRPKMLSSARGTTTVRQSMEGVLRHKSLKRPIRMRVYMHEQTSEASSNVVETGDWIEFR
ncbi:MAG TPA: cupin domain-containing protein [Thermoanaerobaculia bacterium]|nr:cupin domain-containing protein [Thermoanaerobaculia bacterium]